LIAGFPISTTVKIASLLEPGVKQSLGIPDDEKIQLLKNALQSLPELPENSNHKIITLQRKQ
jgi:hypothetical protein